MNIPPAPSTDKDAARRAKVRRTVWIFAALAVMSYVAFLYYATGGGK